MGSMSPWHWAIVVIVLILLFGSAKLPDAARGIGRSLRIFKSEMKEMKNDGDDKADAVVDRQKELPPVEQPVNTATEVDPESAHKSPVQKKSA